MEIFCQVFGCEVFDCKKFKIHDFFLRLKSLNAFMKDFLTILWCHSNNFKMWLKGMGLELKAL